MACAELGVRVQRVPRTLSPPTNRIEDVVHRTHTRKSSCFGEESLRAHHCAPWLRSNRLYKYMFIRLCASGVANRAENHVNGISSIHRCTGRAALAVPHTGVRVSSVSRESALSRPARDLKLPPAFPHPLGRRIVPVLASRAQLVATLQAFQSLRELSLVPEREPRLQ